jgi:uncharacterized membrane protein YraQ (UPF0718 family)
MKLFSPAEIFDRPFWMFAGLAVLSGAGCYLALGPNTFLASLHEDVGMLALMLPKISAALLIAGFIQVLVPRHKVERWMGEGSGVKGMAVAAGVGVATPGGPMTSFPLVTALQEAGTGRSALIAYLTSWSTLGLQRVLTWEIPLMGVEFAVLRFLASLPLPFIAGFTSRWLPNDAPAPGRPIE